MSEYLNSVLLLFAIHSTEIHLADYLLGDFNEYSSAEVKLLVK